MTNNEFKKQFILTKDGTFTPTYTSDTPIAILDNDDKIIDYDLPNFKLIKTAQEVYDEWIYNNDNPPKPESTEVEKMPKYMLDLDYRLSLQELGGK